MDRTTARAPMGMKDGRSSRFSAISRRASRLARKFIAFGLSGLIAFQPILAQAQQVAPDASALAGNRPEVGAAPNGVPLVDIVTPNSQGLSHNKYNDFNVGAPGLILNNFNGETGTSKLGGITPGNPNLRNSGPASVILNEVTSGNRSALNGPTEVFGGRADVIVANPNGITCDGCGFINTPRATLTTGVPDVGADGRLNGFTVNGGDVTFGARGGNFASGDGAADLFDIVSRSITVNGPVYGKDLRLTAGRNSFDYATGQATALQATSGTPEFAIDGSALGAMQAGRIKMVVTEKGAGVRMRGDMAANAGELTLSADGRISIGNASGAHGVDISSRGRVEASKVTSKARVAVKADAGITLQSVAADGDVALDGGSGLISIAGDTSSLGNIRFSAGSISAGGISAGAAASLTGTSGNISLNGVASSRQDLTLSAMSGAISAGTLISFDNISLKAGLDIALSGDATAAGDVTISGKSFKAGAVTAGVDIAATSASPTGDVIFSAPGNLSIGTPSGAVTVKSLGASGDIDTIASRIQAQTIIAHRSIAIAGSLDVAGQLLGGSDVSVTGGDIAAGAAVAGVDFAATAASASGEVVLTNTGNLTLSATSGDVDVASLLSAGDLRATAGRDISANAVSHGSMLLTAGRTVTLAGQSLAGSAVSITAGNVTIDTLISGVDFEATAASSQGRSCSETTGACWWMRPRAPSTRTIC
ncbi:MULTISPECIES: filamentous hemagglutinin N-terminal domain-containing protein [unclassified Sinorhizobium]|uniref:two-partner secretion domain-containing protein n=1 Tax=unclassified Sinorhizobium TaxID=2613772 RepID=UPI0035234D42